MNDTHTPLEDVIEVESEIEHAPGEDGTASELDHLYRQFALSSSEREPITPARALAEHPGIASGLGLSADRSGWWLDALTAVLAAGAFVLLMLAGEWKIIEALSGGAS